MNVVRTKPYLLRRAAYVFRMLGLKYTWIHQVLYITLRELRNDITSGWISLSISDCKHYLKINYVTDNIQLEYCLYARPPNFRKLIRVLVVICPQQKKPLVRGFLNHVCVAKHKHNREYKIN